MGAKSNLFASSHRVQEKTSIVTPAQITHPSRTKEKQRKDIPVVNTRHKEKEQVNNKTNKKEGWCCVLAGDLFRHQHASLKKHLGIGNEALQKCDSSLKATKAFNTTR